MAHDSILPTQQAAYLAAHMMDNGSSPRAASKVADISRRDTAALLRRTQDSGAASCTQQVLSEYLAATRDQGLGDEARTPEAMELAFPIAPPGDVRRHLAALARHTPQPRSDGALESLAETKESLLNRLTERIHSPEQILRMAVMAHWLAETGYVVPDQSEFIGPSHWPNSRSRLLETISVRARQAETAFLETAALTEAPTHDDLLAHLDETLGPAADVLSEAVSHNRTLRVSYRLPETGTPPGIPVWPKAGLIYAELEEPLPHEDDTLVHGLLAGPPPEPRLVALIIEDQAQFWTHLARADLAAGVSTCTVTEEHDCDADLDFHQRFCRNTALALSRGLEPEPLTRQQRRRIERRGWSVPWHIAVP